MSNFPSPKQIFATTPEQLRRDDIETSLERKRQSHQSWFDSEIINLHREIGNKLKGGQFQIEGDHVIVKVAHEFYTSNGFTYDENITSLNQLMLQDGWRLVKVETKMVDNPGRCLAWAGFVSLVGILLLAPLIAEGFKNPLIHRFVLEKSE